MPFAESQSISVKSFFLDVLLLNVIIKLLISEYGLGPTSQIHGQSLHCINTLKFYWMCSKLKTDVVLTLKIFRLIATSLYFPVFGLNTGKYGPEKLRIWKFFMQWFLHTLELRHCTKKFCIKDFFSKCKKIRRKPRIWS